MKLASTFEVNMDNNKSIQIPESLMRKFEENDLIIFVGSGVSKLCGLPSWKELANYLVDTIFQDGRISYDLSESLKKESPLKALSLCKSIINKDDVFKKHLENRLNVESTKGKDIHKAIRKFECPCITTNYDILLEQNGMLKREDNFDSFLKKPTGKVYYLHGQLYDNINDIIITLKSYCTHYAEEGAGRKILKKLFSEKSVLFIGLGLEEFEIVEHVHVSKNQSRHYALIPTRTYEDNLIKEYKEYYDAINIELISYDISLNGYRELENVLLDWSEQVEAKRKDKEPSKELLDIINRIDEEIATKKQPEVLNLILENKKLLDHYLKTDHLEIFELLKKHNIFSFERIPNDLKKQWLEGLYLLNISKKISLDSREYERYAPLILDIFDSFSKEMNTTSNETINVKKIFIFNTYSEIFLFINNDDLSLELVKTLLNFCPVDNKFINIYILNKIFDKLVIDQNHIKTAELIVKYIIEKMISQKSKEDYTWNLSGIAKNNQFIQNCTDTFVKDVLNLINYNTSPIDIVNHQASDKKSKISLSVKGNIVEVVIENEKNIRFSIPADIEYADRELIVDLVQKEFGKKNCASIANDVKMLYYTNLWNDYSYHSFLSLFDNDNYNHSFVLLKFVANLISEKAVTKEKKEFINDFISILQKYKNPCNKRILLYVYGSNFEKYRDELMSLLKDEKEILFHLSDYEGELYNVLYKNAIELTEQEQKTIGDIIEEGPYTEFLRISLNKEQQRYWQKKWLSTLIVIPMFKKEYDKFNDLDKEWFNVRDSRVRTIIDKSPIKDKEIEKLLLSSPKTLVEEIMKFDKNYIEDEKDFFRENPTPDGLRNSLQNMVSNYPEEILYNINDFFSLPKPYITSICRGLIDAKKEYINHQPFVDFIEKYIKQDDFWIEPKKNIYETDNFIMAVADVISVKTSKIPDLLEKSLSILEVFIENKDKFKIPFDPYRNKDDYIFELINSTLGHTLEALLILAYNNIYIEETKEDTSNIWFTKIKSYFEKLLDEKSQHLHILLGYRFRLFYYLDKKWLLKINFDLNKNSEDWKFYFQSYVLSDIYISEESYKHMKENYLFILKNNSIHKEMFIDRVSEIIAYFFLYEYDDLNSKESLIRQMFIFDRKDIVLKVINTLGWKSKYRINDEERNKYDSEQYDEFKIKKQNERILSFWEYIYNNFKNNDSYKTIMANTIKLLPSVQEVNIAMKEQIQFALRCGNYTEFDFIKDLLNIIKLPTLDDSHVKNCTDILCYYLEKYGKTTYFLREDIMSFVTFLKDISQTELINTLCEKLISIEYTELATYIKKEMKL